MSIFKNFQESMASLKRKKIDSYKKSIVFSAKKDNQKLTKESINGYRNWIAFQQIKWMLSSLVPFLLIAIFFMSAIMEGKLFGGMSRSYGEEWVSFLFLMMIATPYSLYLHIKYDNINSVDIAEKELYSEIK